MRRIARVARMRWFSEMPRMVEDMVDRGVEPGVRMLLGWLEDVRRASPEG